MSKFNVGKEQPMSGLEKFEKEFLKDREIESKGLFSLHKAQDFDGMAKMAHKWKGIAVPYGFNSLENLSKELETACKENDLNDCLRTLKLIESYLSDKKKHIEG